MPYDHPGYITWREAPMGEIGGANQAYAKFAVFQKARLKAVHYTVTTAGTSAAANTQVVNKISGTVTTALGTVTAGTNTVGARVESATFNATLAAGDVVQLNQGADVTDAGIDAPDQRSGGRLDQGGFLGRQSGWSRCRLAERGVGCLPCLVDQVRLPQ